MNIQYYSLMDDDEIPTDIWIYYCAKRLKTHWLTVDPQQLEELASDLAQDARLRSMSPAAAAALWLEPVENPRAPSER